MARLAANPSGAFNRNSKKSVTKPTTRRTHHPLRNLAIATAAIPLAIAAAPEAAIAAGVPEAVAAINPVLGQQLMTFAQSRVGTGWLAPAAMRGLNAVRSASRLTRAGTKARLIRQMTRPTYRLMRRRGARIIGPTARSILGKRGRGIAGNMAFKYPRRL